jgi:hypothetical protein
VAHNSVSTLVDDNGFAITASSTAVVAAGVGTTVIKKTAGRLVRVVVTGAVPTGALTFYDNASTGSGTVLAVIPGSGVVQGQAYDIQMPAANGITAVGATGSAAVTVSYS